MKKHHIYTKLYKRYMYIFICIRYHSKTKLENWLKNLNIIETLNPNLSYFISLDYQG